MWSSLLLLLTIVTIVKSQCPPLQPPCTCAPSIYEPVAIVCENAGSLSNALAAIQQAKNTPVSKKYVEKIWWFLK